MFEVFRRRRAVDASVDRLAERRFSARSLQRDSRTDHDRFASIMTAIDVAIGETEREQVGLSRRVDDVLARAAVTFGNDTDEYLQREPLDSHHQDLFTAEISKGQRRLKELASTLSHLRFVKAAVLTRFPEFSARSINS